MGAGYPGQRGRRRKSQRAHGTTPVDVEEPMLSTGQCAHQSDNHAPFCPPVATPRQRHLQDDDVLDGYEDDDDSFRDIFSQSEDSPNAHGRCGRHLPTSETVEESNIQVQFCEMTAQEMKQILDWWSTNVDNDDDDVPLAAVSIFDQPQNSLNLPDDTDADVNHLLSTSFISVTPSSPPDVSDVWNCTLDTPRNSSFGLLIDQPLPQNVSFFSPIQDLSFLSYRDDETSEACSETFDFTDLGVGAFFATTAGDTQRYAQEQTEEVTRMLFRTQDMADKIASLTETSGAEDDTEDLDKDDDSLSTHDPVTTLPFISLEYPRTVNTVFRRPARNKKVEQNIMTAIQSTRSEDSLLKLYWRDHWRLWLRRRLMLVEAVIVSRCLVHLLPLPLLLYLMHRPKLFRSLLWSTLLLSFVAFLFVTLSWCRFSLRVVAPVNVQLSLDTFLRQPYYASELHYALQTPLPTATMLTECYSAEELVCADLGLWARC